LDHSILGLDIGGANIKYCFRSGEAGSLPFELWKQPDRLADFLQQIPGWHLAGSFGVTMTGELADCFASRHAGVTSICHSVQNAVGHRPVRFYQINGRFVDPSEAIGNWHGTAASNWHALATFVGQILPECIVVDIGSTTTDIIPIVNGQPVADGNSDLTRLQCGELLYTGAVRSPVCAVVHSVHVRNVDTPVAQEFFANMLDVYVILGQIPESESCRHTADGRPATIENSYRRLARMLCAEESELNQSELDNLARQIAAQQQSLLRRAIERLLARYPRMERLAIVGEGAFLVRQLFDPAKDPYQILFSDDLLTQVHLDFQPTMISTAAAVAFLFSQPTNR